MLTVREALQHLKTAGITESEQIVRRWIREGVLKAIPPEKNRLKDGYRIPIDELERFIAQRNPLYPEVKKLRKEVEELREEIKKLKKEE
jgi:predicted nuclease with TOPRIM domain